ncbi:hypothetical protein [Flavobacterium cellulosilyticum]|uniref:Uncharacterized protein n=1 Tax=Flavobacterium cellulosilyticum TaxID=2541731 RepID=A0A4R5C9S6_9FLAO|nr:hypothetical protein [Flavobacterium cellulosilyticum]TDD94943.1 hypothetical protein E0F76_15595 [Flavobacterium cellulosilyticum]
MCYIRKNIPKKDLGKRDEIGKIIAFKEVKHYCDVLIAMSIKELGQTSWEFVTAQFSAERKLDVKK